MTSYGNHRIIKILEQRKQVVVVPTHHMEIIKIQNHIVLGLRKTKITNYISPKTPLGDRHHPKSHFNLLGKSKTKGFNSPKASYRDRYHSKSQCTKSKKMTGFIIQDRNGLSRRKIT